MAYKGMMCSDVPEPARSRIGYTNASWTLKCDLTSEYVCRLLNYMDAHGYTAVLPAKHDASAGDERAAASTSPRATCCASIDEFPKQGAFAPWRLYQNYALDLVMLRHAPVADGAMQFSTPNR